MKGERSTEELMGQIGGQEMSTKDEVKAMRELSERLGMSTPKAEKPTPEESAERQRMETSGEIHSLSESEKEQRLDQAAQLGREPGMHFKSAELQLGHRIGTLQKDQQRVREGRRDAMIIAQGDEAYERKVQEEARKVEERALEIQEDIDRLEGLRQKFHTITEELKGGNVRPAREELGREIDTIEGSIMQADRNIALAKRGEIKGGADTHEQQKQKLEDRRDRLRHMIGNLSLYKK